MRSSWRRQSAVAGDNAVCERYLTALFADAPADTFIELRFRTHSGMGRAFYPAGEVQAVASAVARLSERTDVYVGVIPRRRRAGTRADLVPRGSALWVDCDTPESTASLRDFSSAPSLVIASGTGENCHAYWLLHQSVSIDTIEMANRRLASVLGADLSCSDAPRILRPPPSRNHKDDPPTSVRLLHCNVNATYRVDEVAGVLDDDPRDFDDGLRVERRRDSDDPLLRVEPAVYIERLAGLHAPRHHKVRCPFHDDRTPSLHVYREPRRGWYCYGCRRGGSIYDFAALLWGIEARGSAFVELQRTLTVILAASSSRANRNCSRFN